MKISWLWVIGAFSVYSQVGASRTSCSSNSPVTGTAAPGNPFWMQTIAHNGVSAFNTDPTYKVYRDVSDPKYGARGDGVTDDTDAINRAISDGARCGNMTCQSSTLTPALVYRPAGNYLVKKPLVLYYYTALVGDAKNRPTIIADANFVGIAVIDVDVYAGTPVIPWNCPSSDPEWYCPVNSIFKSVRSVVINTTRIPPGQAGTGLHWQLETNIKESLWKTGAVASWQIYPSMAELLGCGYRASSLLFTMLSSPTPIRLSFNSGVGELISGSRVGFQLTTGGVTEATQSTGSIVVLDGKISASLAAFQTSADQSTSLKGSLVIQNVDLSGSSVGVVDGSGHTLLPGGGRVNQFVLGNVFSGTGAGTYSHVAVPGPDLPPALLDPTSSNNGIFFRIRPQYATFASSQFASARANGVVCDGKTVVTQALQNFINKFWGCNILYLDAGTCVVDNTIVIPTGTIVVGEFWTTILASGANFADASNPRAVGNPNDVGDVEISDIVISTVGGSSGAIAVEWNPRGDAGKVGMWDVHIRFGGAIGSKMQVAQCSQGTTSKACQGAFLGLHVAATGSGYFENVWVWSADHDLDDNPAQDVINSYSARGIFIDHAVGPAFYQYSIVGSKNVYAGMIQTETPYYQPNPAPPGSFQVNADWDDPEWSHSGSAWALNIATMVQGSIAFSSIIHKTAKIPSHVRRAWRR
ncbi:exo-beta-1,3-glucanase [Mycena floridula]|nr:exo-beta-1,3-glucanase [Mycena floridula]